MSNRIAFFANANDLIETFDLDPSGEVIFEPNYNIARGQHIPILTDKEGEFVVNRMRWGIDFENKAEAPKKTDSEGILKLENNAADRAIIPMSGFYIWKDEEKKDHPFFVRKIDNTLLYAAGFIFRNKSKDYSYVELIMTESNTLIQPINETMPCILKAGMAKDWLSEKISARELLKNADSQFLITDLTVHRVTKEVKDLSNNEPSIIQPIPK